jgi:uncharacterized glyoxalase superfamily protein PhnB
MSDEPLSATERILCQLQETQAQHTVLLDAVAEQLIAVSMLLGNHTLMMQDNQPQAGTRARR